MSDSKDMSIILFSGDWDKVMAAMILATGAASEGRKVTIFCTFWGLNLLKKNNGVMKRGSSMLTKMLNLMNRGGAKHLGLSKFNMAGMGPMMIKHLAKKNRMPSIPGFIGIAKDMGVRFIACTTSLAILDIGKDDLIDGVDDFAGVATYLESATKSGINLFI